MLELGKGRATEPWSRCAICGQNFTIFLRWTTFFNQSRKNLVPQGLLAWADFQPHQTELPDSEFLFLYLFYLFSLLSVNFSDLSFVLNHRIIFLC